MSEPDPQPPAAAGDPGRVIGERTVFSDFSSVVAARIASAVLSAASVLMATRIIAPSEYGAYAYFGIISLLIFQVSSSWTSSSVVRYGREALETRGDMRAVTWGRWRIVRLLALAVPILAVGLELAGAFPPQFGWSFLALSIIYGWLTIAGDHVLYVMDAAGEMKRSAAGTIGQQLIAVLTVAAMYITGFSHSPEVIAAASSIGLAAMTIAFGARHWSAAFWPPARDAELTGRMRRFSRPLIGFTVSLYVISSVDVVTIRGLINIAAAGVYAVAYRAYTLLQQGATASGQVLTPLFVSLHRRERGELIQRYVSRGVAQITLLVATLLGVGAPFVFSLVGVVFGSRYTGAGLPLTILLAAVALYWTTNLLATVLVLHERTRAVALVNGAAALVNIVLDLLLIGPLHAGIGGAAIATAAALAAIMLAYWALAAKAVATKIGAGPCALIPVLAGVATASLVGAPWRIPAAIGLTLLSAMLVQCLARLFTLQDAWLVDRLDMPDRVRPLARRMITLAAALARP